MKRIICILLAVMISLFAPVLIFAHGGRTDSSGGHRDNNNVSGLGPYHYHHGYPAHLHPNGVCPYAATPSYEDDSDIDFGGNDSEPFPDIDFSALSQSGNESSITSEPTDDDFNIRLYDRDLENLLARLGTHRGYQFPRVLPSYDEYIAREKNAANVMGMSPQDVIYDFTVQDLSSFMVIGFEHGFSVGYLMSGVDSYKKYEQAIAESKQHATEFTRISADLANKELILSDLSDKLEQVNSDYAEVYNRLKNSFVLIAVLFGILVYIGAWYFFIRKKALAAERLEIEHLAEQKYEEKMFRHLAEMHRGSINPYTNTPIENADDYKQYWQKYEEDRLRRNGVSSNENSESETSGETVDDSLKGTPFNTFHEMQLGLLRGKFGPVFSSYSRALLNNAAASCKRSAAYLMFAPYICSLILLAIFVFSCNLSPYYLCFFLLSIIIPIFYREGMLSFNIVLISLVVCIIFSFPAWITAALFSLIGAMIGVKFWWSRVRKILTSAVLSDIDMLKYLFESGALSLVDQDGNLIMRHISL